MYNFNFNFKVLFLLHIEEIILKEKKQQSADRYKVILAAFILYDRKNNFKIESF
jgi:hypothetical protein